MRELTVHEVNEVSGGYNSTATNSTNQMSSGDWLTFAGGVGSLIVGACSPGPATTAAGIYGGTAMIGSATGYW